MISLFSPGAVVKCDSAMTTPNFKNRTLWTGDNLDIMRGLNSETVDLIYLDPPFNSNRDYAAPIGSEAAGAAFKDTWTLSDVDLAWHGLIAEENPGLYGIIDAAGEAGASVDRDRPVAGSQDLGAASYGKGAWL